MNKMETLVADIVEGISSRPNGVPMAELNLICRRFAGTRPPIPVAEDGGRLPATESSPPSSEGIFFLLSFYYVPLFELTSYHSAVLS